MLKLALLTAAVALVPSAAAAQLSFQAPALTGMAARQAAAGSCTIGSGSPLTAVLPQTGAGVTLAAPLELFVYIPRNNAQFAELQVFEAETAILTASLDLPPSFAPGDFQYGPALAQLTLTTPPITPDVTYRWQVTLVCDAGDRSQDVAVSGLLLVAGPDYLSRQSPPLATSAETTAEQLAQYAAAGLWHELLSQLIALSEQDPSYEAMLAQLLSEQGLGAIVDAPRTGIGFTPLR